MSATIVLVAAANAAEPGHEGEASYPTAPDYANPAAWACRPDADRGCAADLDAVVLKPDGSRSQLTFTPATDPPIDCFYVYPTISREQQAFADLDYSPEVRTVVRLQAGRLMARCRLYAPLYRQATLYHLRHLRGQQWEGPDQDIAAAWAYYMAHDNKGRGVVLVGHSQGTILLQRLIAQQIDGKPAQARFISAFLAGDPGLLVPQGRTVGGTFKQIPVCTGAAQTGCVYVWASYFAGDDAPRIFGVNRDGLAAACASPANPAGSGALDAYFEQKYFPVAASSNLAEVVSQINAVCRTDAQGQVLRIEVPPGPNADALQAMLKNAQLTVFDRDWGLHRVDVALTQGNILSVIDAETAAWKRKHH